MTAAEQPKPSITREYWTHNVGELTGPVAQFRMSQLVDYDSRLTDPARTVYRFLIGWYVKGHGDALASVRHIVATMRARAPDGARHISRSAVQRAIALLMDTGWLVRRSTGKGRSGSRYVPVLNVLELAAQGNLPAVENDSVPLHRDTTNEAVASHSTGTVVSHSTGTLQQIASHSTGTKTLLPDPRTDAGTDRENIDCAPPSAPPGSALGGPTGADGHKRGKTTFDELYDAYGHRQRRADARAAYDIVGPDADLHRTMVEAADAWHAHWARQNNPVAPRKTLAKWIETEGYLEDPPAGYVPKERKQKVAPAPAKSDGQPRRGGPIAVVGQVVDGKVISADDSTYIHLVICNADDSQEWTRRIALECRDSTEQYDGQREFANLCSALELDGVNDTSEMLFKPFVIKSGAGSESGPIEYAAYTPEIVREAA